MKKWNEFKIGDRYECNLLGHNHKAIIGQKRMIRLVKLGINGWLNNTGWCLFYYPKPLNISLKLLPKYKLSGLQHKRV